MCTCFIKIADQTNVKLNPTQVCSRCQENALLWKRLHSHGEGRSDTPRLSNEPVVFDSISDAIGWVGGVSSPDTHLQVLVCGSLYLVGGVLASLGYNTDTLLQNERIR